DEFEFHDFTPRECRSVVLCGMADRLSNGGERPPASSTDWRKLVGCGTAQQGFGPLDRTGAARGVGPSGQGKRRLETYVALDAEAERQANRGGLRQTEMAELWAAEAKVGKAEQGVVIVIEFGREPC